MMEAVPGDYVYDEEGNAVGRLKYNLCQDRRFKANGAYSKRNGYTKTTGVGITRQLDKCVARQSTSYIAKLLTIVLPLFDIAPSTWANHLTGLEVDEVTTTLIVELSQQEEATKMLEVVRQQLLQYLGSGYHLKVEEPPIAKGFVALIKCKDTLAHQLGIRQVIANNGTVLYAQPN